MKQLIRKNKLNWLLFITVFAIITAVYFFAGFQTIPKHSMTHDEHQYFVAGLYYLKYHDLRFNRSNAPLLKYIFAVPLTFLKPIIPKADESYIETHYDNREYAVKFFTLNPKLFFKMLYTSRIIVYALQIVGIFGIFFLGYLLYSPLVGFISVILYAFNLPLFAHSTLATLDIGLASCSIFFYIFLYRAIKKPSYISIILASLFFGIALSVKFSILIMFPFYIRVLLLFVKPYKKLLIYIPLSITVICLTVFVAYGFEFAPLFRNSKFSPKMCSNNKICNALVKIPIPFPSLIRGSIYQLQVSKRGWSAYIFGHTSTSGWWYYFPTAFILKNQLALSMLLFIGILLYVKKARNFFTLSNMSNIYLSVLIVLVLSYFMFFSHINIGVRYLFFLFPLIIVLAAAAFQQIWKDRLIFKLIAGLLLFWYVFSWIKNYPHALSYSNELTGGPSKTNLYLSDSDCDWGQSLPSLKSYMTKNNIKKIYLLYFGYDDPTRYGIDFVTLPNNFCETIHGYVAISTTPLNNPLYAVERNCIDWVKKTNTFSDLVEYSIKIYKVP